jgi:hypothetical protein
MCPEQKFFLQDRVVNPTLSPQPGGPKAIAAPNEGHWVMGTPLSQRLSDGAEMKYRSNRTRDLYQRVKNLKGDCRQE